MNVADFSIAFSSRRVAAQTRRDPIGETETNAALKKLRDAQKIAPGKRVDDEPDRRERFERRPTPAPSAETPADAPRRADDERGRLLDVYC